jgi:hypothetical protein
LIEREDCKMTVLEIDKCILDIVNGLFADKNTKELMRLHIYRLIFDCCKQYENDKNFKIDFLKTLKFYEDTNSDLIEYIRLSKKFR